MRNPLSRRALATALLAVAAALTLAPAGRSQSAADSPRRPWFVLYLRLDRAGSPPPPWVYHGTYPTRRAALDAAEVPSVRGYQVWIRPVPRWYFRAPPAPALRQLGGRSERRPPSSP